MEAVCHFVSFLSLLNFGVVAGAVLDCARFGKEQFKLTVIAQRGQIIGRAPLQCLKERAQDFSRLFKTMMDRQFQSGFAFGPFRLDTMKRCLLREGAPVTLQPKDFETLLVLVEQRDRVVGKDELVKLLWPDTFVEEANLSQHIYVLRKALGDTGHNHNYIVTVPGRGYRFVAPVTEWAEKESQPQSPAVEKAAEAQCADEKPIAGRFPTALRRGWFVATALLVVAAATGGLWRATNAPSNAAVAPPKSIAVLPFKPLRNGEGDDEYLGLGLADSLITKLGGLRQLVVRPTSAVRKYSGPEQDPLAAGREQRVEAVLEASLQRNGERIRVTARLLQIGNGATLWTYQCDEQYCADIFAMQDAITEKVATALMRELSGEERKLLRRHGTENREAHLLYLKGRWFLNKSWSGQVRKGIECFQQSLALDQHYAPAYAGLADAYWGMVNAQSNAAETMPKAKAAALKALELDPELAEAHAALANVRAFYDWDWAAAEREFKQALAFNPSLAEGHLGYSQFLSALGRHQEALAEIEQARRLDPLSLLIRLREGDVFYHARRFDEALTRYRETLEMDAHFPIARYRIGQIYTQQGKYDEAIAEFEKEMTAHLNNPRSPIMLAMLARTCALAGQSDKALKLLEEAQAAAKPRYVTPWAVAAAYAALGEREHAFAWLERAYAERAFRLVFLQVEPVFDELRSEPRFAALLRRVGLP
jgi:DNA-binding winged helix-turn-helix (wHTH) protein/TolB-like protein/Tfp pilus assembly protein PilF